MKTIIGAIILGVGIAIGWHIAKCCMTNTPPTREAKKTFKPHVVEKGQDNATRDSTDHVALVASHNKKANS